MADSSPIETEWFRERLAAKKLTQRAVARLLGINPSGLSLMLKGSRTMKLQEAAHLARLLGVPTTEVLARAGVEQDGKADTMQIAGWLDNHGEIHFEAELGAIDRPHGLEPDAMAVQARTAGSDLDYMDGWLLFAGKPVEPPPIEHVGRLCLVRMTEGIVYLAQPRRGYKRGLWNLAGPLALATDVALDWTAPILNILT